MNLLSNHDSVCLSFADVVVVVAAVVAGIVVVMAAAIVVVVVVSAIAMTVAADMVADTAIAVLKTAVPPAEVAETAEPD